MQLSTSGRAPRGPDRRAGLPTGCNELRSSGDRLYRTRTGRVAGSPGRRPREFGQSLDGARQDPVVWYREAAQHQQALVAPKGYSDRADSRRLSAMYGPRCQGHFPVSSTSRLKLKNVRTSTIPARVATDTSVGLTATVRMMSAAMRSSRPSKIARPASCRKRSYTRDGRRQTRPTARTEANPIPPAMTIMPATSTPRTIASTA
jgi:hypothetical protein